MSAHTPGPWEVREGYGLLMAEVGPADRAVATVWTKRAIAGKDKVEQVEWPEGQANACLIAASPDLLVALLMYLDPEDPASGCEDQQSANEARERFYANRERAARAAIAKSGGAS